jgi:hypothetical protein
MNTSRSVEKRVEVVERLRGAWRYVSSHELKGFGFKISLLGLTLPHYCKLLVNQQYYCNSQLLLLYSYFNSSFIISSSTQYNIGFYIYNV